MTRILALLLVLLPATTCVTCVKNYYPPQSKDTATPTPTEPTPIPVTHVIEYRVLGTAHSASVSYGSAQDGTTEVQTITPWSSSFTTTRTTLFVFISAFGNVEGTVRVQIFIDAVMFREASTDGTIGQVASASGTVQLSSTATGAAAIQDLGDHPELRPSLIPH